MPASPLKVKIILGSTRPNRFSDKPGAWILKHASAYPGLEVELLDLRDYPMPFYHEDHSLSTNPKVTDPIAQKWTAKIAEADTFIVVTPEYNHGYPAVLKNAFDYVYKEWNRKPIGFVAYGSVAGARSVEQLRQVAIELQMAPIRKGLHIHKFWLLTDEKGNLKPGALDDMNGEAKDFLDQLTWWGKALKEARERK